MSCRRPDFMYALLCEGGPGASVCLSVCLSKLTILKVAHAHKSEMPEHRPKRGKSTKPSRESFALMDKA
jgi:hypothetical protein